MKNKWRFFAVILAVVLCMTVFSVTAYAGGDMVDSTMGDPTMENPTATTQPENTNTGEQTPNGQTLTVLVTETADGSHTVTIGDRMLTLKADELANLCPEKTTTLDQYICVNNRVRVENDAKLLELGQTTPEQAVADMKTQIEINLDADLVEYK